TLERCRARHWPFTLERRRASLAARHLPAHGRGRLRPGTVGHGREPFFLLSHSYPVRPWPARCHHGTLRLRPPSRIHRGDPDHSSKRTRARIVARGRAPCDLQPAVPTPSSHHGGQNSSSRACGLRRLCRAGSMAACPRHLVKANPRGSVPKLVAVCPSHCPLPGARRTLGAGFASSPVPAYLGSRRNAKLSRMWGRDHRRPPCPKALHSPKTFQPHSCIWSEMLHLASSPFNLITHGQAASSGGQGSSSLPMRHYPRKAISPSRYRAATPSRPSSLDVITLLTSRCCASSAPTCSRFG